MIRIRSHLPALQKSPFISRVTLSPQRAATTKSKRIVNLKYHPRYYPTGILGGGDFATAMAAHLGRSGFQTHCFIRKAPEVESRNATGHSINYLNKFQFVLRGQESSVDPKFEPMTCRILPRFHQIGDLQEKIEHLGLRVLFLGIPSIASPEQFGSLRGIRIPKDMILVSLIKAVIRDPDNLENLIFPTTLLQRYLPHNPIFYMGGPSFAEGIAQNKLTQLTTVAINRAARKKITDLVGLMTKSGRSELLFSMNTDAIGVQLGGVLKNCLAFATGACSRLEKYNSQNSLTTVWNMGFNDMVNFALLSGARLATIRDAAFSGDYHMTSNDRKSRNFRAGETAIDLWLQSGKERKPDMTQIQNKLAKDTIEGMYTLSHIAPFLDRAEEAGVRLSVLRAAYEFLFTPKSPKEIIRNLQKFPSSQDCKKPKPIFHF